MSLLPYHNSLSINSDGILREILTEITVTVAYAEEGSKAYKGIALWDTGATNSAITDKAAGELGLEPIDKEWVIYGSGKHLRNVYLLDIMLPNAVVFPGIRATECVHTDQCKFGILIGMDVICKGDFALTNVGGKTTFTYRHPSIREIDFVVETKRHNDEIDRENAKRAKTRKQPYYKGLKKR